MFQNKEEGKVFRELLIGSVDSLTKCHDRVALSLSGGIDSACILYSLLELEKEFTCYTFFMEGYVSTDLKSSRMLCDKYSLDLVECRIPKYNLKNDLITLAKLGCDRKTYFETKIHLLYLYPCVEEELLLNGDEADKLHGSSRAMIYNGRNNHEDFNRLRLESWDSYKEDLSISQKIASRYDLKLAEPYYDDKLLNFFLQYDWKYLNEPVMKSLSVCGFYDYFKEDGYRKVESYQINSGMRDYLASFVNDESLNFNNRKRMQEVYKDLYNKYQHQQLME